MLGEFSTATKSLFPLQESFKRELRLKCRCLDTQPEERIPMHQTYSVRSQQNGIRTAKTFAQTGTNGVCTATNGLRVHQHHRTPRRQIDLQAPKGGGPASSTSGSETKKRRKSRVNFSSTIGVSPKRNSKAKCSNADDHIIELEKSLSNNGSPQEPTRSPTPEFTK